MTERDPIPRINHYFWNAYNSNFGDALGADIVAHFSGGQVRPIDLNRERSFVKHARDKGLFGLGSIFVFVEDHDIVWGTGVNLRWPPYKLKTGPDIRAVRGPLTADHLRREIGIDCPSVFGDPAQLLHRLIDIPPHQPVRRFGLIPHYRDIPVVPKALKEIATHKGWRGIDALRRNNTIYPFRPWREIVEFIAGCEMVISSSLHGLIVAEQLGVPAVWWRSDHLPSTRTEHSFKYNDYYAATDRDLDNWSTSLGQALQSTSGFQKYSFDSKALEEAFPHELFSQTC
ncbi:polysaccharide pyruvyl transferase family protein [Cognatishimia sp.]|uniref:polysaccharide pyruvyl transferase family protein n=1 Tax=Cognatishimia sp. TaxID=2211648 RepID=UPI003517C899